jgi:hypothetical protein
MLRSKLLKDQPFWQSLGKTLSLTYWPNRDAIWAHRHRLIGFWKGYIWSSFKRVCCHKGILKAGP